jgi:predicted DNA-binding transcriptional regulator YafY
MSVDVLCKAISDKRLVQFYYTGDGTPGTRTVEPHMVAENKANHLALSAWYLSGASESGQGPGWREYLISDISNATELPGQFSGPRQGYKSDGGKSFHNIRCAL